VLELGATGASLRVLWVTLTGIKGHRVEPRSQEFVIPQEVVLGAGQQVSAQCPALVPWSWDLCGQS
jgi:hexokinase